MKSEVYISIGVGICAVGLLVSCTISFLCAQDINKKVGNGQCSVTNVQAGVDCNLLSSSRNGNLASIFNLVLGVSILILVMVMVVTHSHPHG